MPRGPASHRGLFAVNRRGFSVEDTRQQWREAPGPPPGLHGVVENAADPANWVRARIGMAGAQLRGQLGQHLPLAAADSLAASPGAVVAADTTRTMLWANSVPPETQLRAPDDPAVN